jgi:hypothetical protein
MDVKKATAAGAVAAEKEQERQEIAVKGSTHTTVDS